MSIVQVEMICLRSQMYSFLLVPREESITKYADLAVFPLKTQLSIASVHLYLQLMRINLEGLNKGTYETLTLSI